jgi:hypothetical protein
MPVAYAPASCGAKHHCVCNTRHQPSARACGASAVAAPARAPVDALRLLRYPLAIVAFSASI